MGDGREERTGSGRLRPARAALAAFLVALAAALLLCFSVPLVEIHHAAETYARRSGDFTVNITGSLGPHATGAKYRLNGASWRDLRCRAPRVPPPRFTIELDAEELRSGRNSLEIEASLLGMARRLTALCFVYDPAPVVLPRVEDWSSSDLDVQDGCWETFQLDGQRRVRPRVGHEGYDRIAVVTGAFSGGRRVETDVIFRGNGMDGPFGFGVLPLWGGRPDEENVLPRRGWNFSLAWYYSYYEAVGQEFSYKRGAEPPAWVATYRNLDLERDVRYFVIVECWPRAGETGEHAGFEQRMKWWREGEPEPGEWMALSDAAGAPLPPGEFCVALISHRSQVDFGPVTVKPLGPGGAPR